MKGRSERTSDSRLHYKLETRFGNIAGYGTPRCISQIPTRKVSVRWAQSREKSTIRAVRRYTFDVISSKTHKITTGKENKREGKAEEEVVVVVGVVVVVVVLVVVMVVVVVVLADEDDDRRGRFRSEDRSDIVYALHSTTHVDQSQIVAGGAQKAILPNSAPTDYTDTNGASPVSGIRLKSSRSTTLSMAPSVGMTAIVPSDRFKIQGSKSNILMSITRHNSPYMTTWSSIIGMTAIVPSDRFKIQGSKFNILMSITRHNSPYVIVD
ncbi:hypothetical protein EAI_13946 [Harpegnathos saltator]|uniref:Uncharacterized protein n=1 Tax=Harpegnathos saltator TaxID=610380 RepID=E2C259_HARSA|nr:hypothetical protein EAI_13946 [Harpegnathos saltator]